MNVTKIHRYIWEGRKDVHWYKDCEELFAELFGEDRLKLVCNLFAATSINTSLKSNITLFRRAFYEMENNLPVGNYLPNIQLQLRRIRAGEPLSGRKIRSFAAAMSGDPNAVVVDIWLLRAFDMDKKYWRTENSAGKPVAQLRSAGASELQYTQIEGWIRHEAHCMGIEPRELSAIIWSGVRIVTSGDRETHYKTILKGYLTNLFNAI